MILTILAFIACSTIVFLAGVQVAKAGDVIAQKTGLGRTWIGVVLVASVTSLPEVTSGASAVTMFDVPEIAVGGIVGSCAINLLIIALLDSTSRTSPILSRVSQGHVLSAGFGVGLLAIVIFALISDESTAILGWISPYSLGIIALYLIAMRTIFHYERNQRLTLSGTGISPDPTAYESVSSGHTYFVFGFNAALIVVAATFLPGIGERLSEQAGLDETIIGTLLIALATSLPEVVVALTAISIGAADLALGGLLGSNLFNVGILGLIDVLYLDAPIYSEATSANASTAGIAILLTAVAIIGLVTQPSRKPPYLSWDAGAMVGIYIVGMFVIFSQG